MIHVLIERNDLDEAKRMARELYQVIVQTGRHALLDAPGDFRTNLPERRLSSAEVVVTARQFIQPSATPQGA